jgi:Arc/MetJ-type ribon-helix-helix transcriptional regulator
MPNERVTVTLPSQLLDDIDQQERNRSKFIRRAIRRELERRRRKALRASLSSPHSEASEVAGFGLDEWVAAAAEGDEALVDSDAGTAVEWVPGHGWTEVEG